MDQIPIHIGIIMDGNGRWAKKRFLPRVFGHVRGVSALKKTIMHCNDIGVKHLTVFAFGRENWQRPNSEVNFLMKLMLKKLNHELSELHAKNARIRFIGDRSRLNKQLLDSIIYAESQTQKNTGLQFNVCLDYSGQYDIVQAVNRIIKEGKHEQINEEILAGYLLTHDQPAPELIIRTSGECRLSNFMLWQSAYSELYFTPLFWPEFSPQELDKAIEWYNNRERRFGQISEQLKEASC
ncbi:MAG: di-trans,poly-cis-decaprenylcistransferase [Proteobacteria bacterium]|nr:MAG: di-trans,poly-cis-decaprenylcistransferase [Pseudomonadota bacterium]